jgi:hypothetical protein
MIDDLENLVGFLYRLSDKESAREVFSLNKNVDNWVSIVEGDWYSFVWHASHESIKFVLRDGKDRFMLLSQDQAHVQSFLSICGIENRLERPRISISNFVNDLIAPVNDSHDAKSGRQYRISTIFAAVDGYGRSLKTMALWGDDLINAELFISLIKKINPYRITVRELLRDVDIASLGSNGEVNFYFRGQSQLQKIDNFFRFLKKRGYIHWTVHSEGDENGGN